MKSVSISTICLTLMAIFLFGCKKSIPDPAEPDDTDTVEVIRVDTIFSVNTGTTLDGLFWSKVQAALGNGNVMVRFAVGEYTLTAPIVAEHVGHDEHTLFLQSESTGRAIFDGEIANLLELNSCRNIRVRGLAFTGKVTAYALRVSNGQRISIENCSFQDLSATTTGALGILQSETDRITIKNCRFQHIGISAGAHMIDATHGVTRLTVVNSYFKDCSGSFIRFRGDLSDMGVFYKNDFISTGTYRTGVNPVFIEVAAVNEVNPGNERLGTNFMFADNTFSYGNMGSQTSRYAVVFHSSGFNPADRNYQLSAADGEKLQNGTATEKQAIMTSQLGLDGDKIHFGKNINRNVAYRVAYRHTNNYGAAGPWTGVADIEPVLNTAGPVTSEEEALIFYP